MIPLMHQHCICVPPPILIGGKGVGGRYIQSVLWKWSQQLDTTSFSNGQSNL